MGIVSPKGILILQARMDSTRLPGKSSELIGGVPLVGSVIQRLDSLPCPKWLATSNSKVDDQLAQIARSSGWSVYRGSADNVLSRYEEILRGGEFDYCIRATGDNPMVCPEALKLMINSFTTSVTKIDYMSDFDYGFFPAGAFAEIFSVPKFLLGLNDIPESEPWHYSHVTSWMRKSTQKSPLTLPVHFEPRPGWRWTVDYQEDLEFIRNLILLLGESWMTAPYPKIVEVIDQNLKLLEINKGFSQKNIKLG
jgi:spore coat polysaccharide biosynthesis protein SpsF